MLFRSPSALPWHQTHPLTTNMTMPINTSIGCRVIPAANMRELLAMMPAGSSPSYGQLLADLPSPFRGAATRAGRRIEDFIERLVTCKEGFRATTRQDAALNYVFGGRTAPISAAIGITISAPSA